MFVQILFRQYWRSRRLHSGTRSCSEHWATRGHHGCEIHKSDFWNDIVINSFHAAAEQVSFVPETDSTRILQKLLPPFPVRIRARPTHQGLLIAPVLAYADMHREKGKDKIFVEEQSVGMSGSRGRDLRSESKQRLDSGNAIYAHAEVDDNQVGITRKINRSSLDAGRHKRKSIHRILHWRRRLPRRIKERQRSHLHIRLQPDRLDRDLHLQLRPQFRVLSLDASQCNHFLKNRRPTRGRGLANLLVSRVQRHSHTRSLARRSRSQPITLIQR